MGSRGPVPKRKSQTRRRNKKDVQEAPAGAPSAEAGLTDYQKINPRWHPIARQWFRSLRESGQSRFYEPSDWMLAQIIAESMSREFNPQNAITKNGIVKVILPPKSASLTVWLQAMTALLATEGERRRAQLELQHGGGGATEEAMNESNVLQLYTDEFAGESS